MLTNQDLEQIAAKGISEGEILTQIDNLKKGFPFVRLDCAATVGHGITTLSEDKLQYYVGKYEQQMPELSVMKFVPASGAASRMFKDLNVFFKECKEHKGKAEPSASVVKTMENIGRFAFHDKLQQLMAEDGKMLDDLALAKDYKTVVDYILNSKGLNYGHLPKAMLMFHLYGNVPRSAFSEHLVEGAHYAKNAKNEVNLHFTISPEHRKYFNQKLKYVVPQFEEMFGVKYNIKFSEQMSKTDMVAIDMDGNLVRNADGSLLFRPGGHGALIENLNQIDADIVFIKNIDNVTVDKFKPVTYTYKKALAGYLIEMQEITFECMRLLENLSVSEAELAQIEGYAMRVLNINVPFGYFSKSHRQKVAYWQKKLNRPIRVCGMVKNEGEPGGGPYWVFDKNGDKNLQIVESSQIDFSNKFQVAEVQKSSHFNPVDLVCGLKNFRGNKFNLKNYVNRNTGFISQKNQNGIDMKIQELPGLWNGAMADWITAFVEVPVSTFTPVKTLNDLLRPEHIE